LSTHQTGLDLVEAARQLRTQLDFAGASFWLGAVFADLDKDRRALGAIAEEDGGFRRTVALSPPEPSTLVDQVLTATSPVWIDLTAPQTSAAWRDAVWTLVSRLNERRERMRRAGQALVLAGPHWLKPEIRDAGPDLWSIVEMRLELGSVDVTIDKRAWVTPSAHLRKLLYSFTVSAFSATELRRLVRYNVPDIHDHIAWGTSLAQVTEGVLDAAIRQGTLDVLVRAMEQERPRRASELHTIKEALGLGAPEGPPVSEQVSVLPRRYRARFNRELEQFGVTQVDLDHLPELIELAKARGADEHALRQALDRALES